MSNPQLSQSTRNEVAKKLDALAALPRNWDSHGGLPLKDDARQAAQELVGWADFNNLPAPAVVLTSSGTVQFEWRCGGRELEIEVLGNNSMGFLKVFNDARMEEGEETINLPEKLRELLGWLHSPRETTAIPDTDGAMCSKQMAEAFSKLGTPTTESDVELSVDADKHLYY